MKSIRTNPANGAPEGDESLVCMVFDGETGNAVDAFEFTVAELERQLRILRGDPVVTLASNPWATLANQSAEGIA